MLGGFDGAQVVGTHATFHTELTVPGGAPLGTQQSLERGEAASILIPSEWPIYGRHGYGHTIISASVLAETPAVRARLMQFLWEHDWVVRVDVDMQQSDDAWRLFGSSCPSRTRTATQTAFMP